MGGEYCKKHLNGETVQGLEHGAYDVLFCPTLPGECPNNNDGEQVQRIPSKRFYVHCLSQGLQEKPNIP